MRKPDIVAVGRLWLWRAGESGHATDAQHSTEAKSQHEPKLHCKQQAPPEDREVECITHGGCVARPDVR